MTSSGFPIEYIFPGFSRTMILVAYLAARLRSWLTVKAVIPAFSDSLLRNADTYS